MYVYVPHVCVWHSQELEEGVHPLELEFQTIVNCHVGSGNLTQVLWKVESSQCL